MVRKHSLSKRGKHLAACCALALSAATSGSCVAAPILFDIKDQQLSEALLSFARQADVSIIFSADSDFDVQLENSFKGEFEPGQLLKLLLKGTALEAEFIHSDVVAIRPLPCLSSASCKDDDLAARDDRFYQLASNPMLEQMLVVGRTMTGSRIRRTEFNGTAPVDIISAFDIELAGAQTIGDLLRDLPSVVGNSTSTSISNGGDGTASVTLRGLPASNTLVLVNGRRIANDGLAGESFDLNSLAPSSVDRIEVLKSGSSAVYGSDAIAGVINIILKKEYDGLQVDTYHGSSSENDLQTTTSSFAFGRVFDHSSFFVSGTVYDQGEILSRERAVSANTDTRLLGGEDQSSSATPNARVTLGSGQVVTLASNAADPLDPGSFRTVNDADLFNFAQFSTAIVPSERKSMYGSFNVDVGDRSTAYVDYGFTRTKASAQLAPVPIFTAFESIPLTVSADNVFNPFGEEIADVRKRLLELGPRTQTNEADAHRAAFGLQGRRENVHWDVNWHWSKTDAHQTISNLLDARRLQRALGGPGECAGLAIDGCEPVDLFSASGSLPLSQQQFIQSEAVTRGFFKLYGGSANAAFTAARLPAGQLDVAAGLEYRRESTAIGPLDPDLITLGGANLSASSGSRSVREVYLEALVPILRTEHGREKLSLELASRYSHYSDFGESFNPRAAVKFRPMRGLLFRMSYAEGFRAPSLLELHKSSAEDQAFLTDPCSIASNLGVLAGCVQQTDATRLQFLTINGGNLDLLPEESEFSSVGMIWTPPVLQNFSAAIDFFSIDQNNVVDANAQFILDQNAENGAFAGRVVRAANGEIERIIATNINIGKRELDGIDFSFNYALPKMKQGRFHLSLNASRLHSYKEQLNPELPGVQLVGKFADEASAGRGALPKWKANFGAYWKYKQWQINYTLHHISSLDEQLSTGQSRRISSWTTHDVQTSFLFLVADGLRLTFGVKNLTDRDAPLAASAFNDNIDARTHNLIGRYWYAKLAQKF